MIDAFVKAWDARKHIVRSKFEAAHPNNYEDIVRAVIEILADDYGSPDPSRIHEINDGNWQGTLLYVIAAEGYQPSTYWAVKVSYGSCSACDTLQSIKSDHPFDDDNMVPTASQVDRYMTLALHIIQGLKEIE